MSQFDKELGCYCLAVLETSRALRPRVQRYQNISILNRGSHKKICFQNTQQYIGHRSHSVLSIVQVQNFAHNLPLLRCGEDLLPYFVECFTRFRVCLKHTAPTETDQSKLVRSFWSRSTTASRIKPSLEKNHDDRMSLP